MGVPNGAAPEAAGQATPDLAFEVEGVDVVRFAAAPTLGFRLGIQSPAEAAIRSITLSVLVRIEPARRSYRDAEKERLLELFGEPHQWSTTLRGLVWARTTAIVPAFSGRTVLEVPIPCTYDMEVATAKYFHALEDGEIPLALLFTGTLFYAGEGGALRTGQIPWEKEASFRLPVRLWRDMMDQYFPDSAWLRLPRETVHRLYAYKARNTLPSLEAAVESLLPADGA